MINADALAAELAENAVTSLYRAGQILGAHRETLADCCARSGIPVHAESERAMWARCIDTDDLPRLREALHSWRDRYRRPRGPRPVRP